MVQVVTDPIKPAPCISFPESGVPATRVILRAFAWYAEEPRIVVRRGVGAESSVRIIKRSWE